jgi:large subunit ribosomal protein L15
MRPGFEGGQMPLQRRLPKRGFTNVFKKAWVEVNLDDLDKRFGASDDVNPEKLVAKGLVKKNELNTHHGVVVLGRGNVTKPLNVVAHRFSRTAREKIEAAGGKAIVAD